METPPSHIINLIMSFLKFKMNGKRIYDIRIGASSLKKAPPVSGP
jgi:hypothetical protein